MKTNKKKKQNKNKFNIVGITTSESQNKCVPHGLRDVLVGLRLSLRNLRTIALQMRNHFTKSNARNLPMISVMNPS